MTGDHEPTRIWYMGFTGPMVRRIEEKLTGVELRSAEDWLSVDGPAPSTLDCSEPLLLHFDVRALKERFSEKPRSFGVQALRWIRESGLPFEVVAFSEKRDRDLEPWLRQMGVRWVSTENELEEHLREAARYSGYRGHVRGAEESSAAPARGFERPRHPLLYRSSKMEQVHELIHRYASRDHDIVILGETGAGKEVVTREIHRLRNPRKERLHPWITFR